MRSRPGSIVGFVVMAVAVGTTVLVGCSDDPPERAADDEPSEITATTSTTAPVVDVEQFTGTVDDFYVVPDPLPTGEPGRLIRVQAVSSDDEQVTTRVMYHSTDTTGADRAATAIVTVPVAAAPEGGWPVVVTAPGTIGLASHCAISRRGEPAPAHGVDGVRVIVDYLGMGPVGETQAYLSRASEGHSVLDGVRAARSLDGVDAGTELLILGHSQGGHGAQSAHELAAGYAPELDLLGTVSGAPAAMFDRTYGGVDDIVSRIVALMGLYGVATDHPEIDPADYLSPDALQLAEDVLDEVCLDEVIETFVPLAVDPSFWAADPVTTDPARTALRANDVGNTAAAAPLLLISGTEDDRVVHARVEDLFDRLCDTGQVTEFVVLEGANHGTEMPIAADRIAGWFADRLDGAAPVDSCAAP